MSISPGDMFKFDAGYKKYKFVYDLVINVDDDYLYVMQCYTYTGDDIIKYNFWKRNRLEDEGYISDNWEKLC